MLDDADRDRQSCVGRRGAMAALGLAPFAIVPLANAKPVSPIDPYLLHIRPFLEAMSGGHLAAFLQSLQPTPVVAELSGGDLDPLLSRLKGVSFDLDIGSVLLRADQQLVDVLLPEASRRTGAMVGAARFVFGYKSAALRLRAVTFSPGIEHLLVKLGGISGATDPQLSAANAQRAYDELAANGGGTLLFPTGMHRVSLVLTNRNVKLAGTGMGATTLMPATPDRPVLEAAYNSGSWQTVEISDLSIVGDGVGDGFRAGHVPRHPQDEFIGRSRFRNVRWANFERCINRPYGQIGLWLEGCIFEGADYHLYSVGTDVPGEPMHAGNIVARDCHFAGARKAVFFLDSNVTGTGQIIFDNCIMEANPGFVFYIKAMNGSEGVPGMVVRSCWNEANGTALSVTIDHPQKPGYAHFGTASMVRFEDTPLGNLTLQNATVVTQDCALDALREVLADAASTLVHRHARGFGSFAPVGLVEDVAATYQFLPNRALSFEMPMRNHSVPISKGATVLLSHKLGAAVQSDRGRIPRPVNRSPGHRGIDQALSLARGEQLNLMPSATVPANHWVAWVFECRLASGPAVALSIVGNSGISSSFPVSNSEPRSIAGMSFSQVENPAVHFALQASQNDSSLIEIGRFQLVAFDTRQGALNFLNAKGVFDDDA